MSDVALRRASNDDIAFIMRVERQPGYDDLVGRWEYAEHEAALGDPANAYLIGLDGLEPRGFAIFRRVDGDAPYLQRAAVIGAGAGYGGRFIEAVMDWAFANTQATRVTLDVMVHNARARRVYDRLGFREDGAARASNRADGALMQPMAIARADWAMRRDGAVEPSA